MSSGSLWRSLRIPLAELDLKILEGGQSFRWKPISQNTWRSVLQGHVISLKQSDSDVLFQNWNSLKRTWEASGTVEEILLDYFNVKVSLLKLYDQWRKTDKHFHNVAAVHPGVRMLRQDPVENLFSFICSSCNNISRITSMVDKLCRYYGEKVATIDGEDFFSFPSVEKLAATGVEQRLREEAFGYRAEYINQAARQLLQGEGVQKLYELRKAEYSVAKAFLVQLPGVGPKVADCVCLMSLDKPAAIPVDTHVWQYAVRDYGFPAGKRKGITKKQYDDVGNLFRGLHGEYAGWAQGVLFTADLKRFKEEVKAPEPEPLVESSKKKKKADKTTDSFLPEKRKK